MWIIFREDKSEFVNPDKYVVALVNDADILTYQSTFSGYYFPVNTDVSYFQEFVRDTEGRLYFARRYEVFRLA
jgi:hypothetical protein